MSRGFFDGKKHERHGLSKTQSIEYRCWNQMLDRCCNPKCGNFKNYGARGILVSARWQYFKQFFADMGRKPSLKHSIERKNNNGNYEPGNCIWATLETQHNNTRTNRFIEFGGERLSCTQWSKRLRASPDCVLQRLKNGFTDEEAVTRPVQARNRLLTFNGKTMNVKQWAAQTGLRAAGINERLRTGWTVAEALSTPKKVNPS